MSFSQRDECALVGFDNGVSVEADVVVAADGIHSVLQRHVVDATVPVFSGTVAYRGLIRASRLRGWPEYLVSWGGGGKHLLAFPVRGGELLNYVDFVPADERVRESWSAPGDPATLQLNSPTGIHRLGTCLRTWTPHSRGDSMIVSH